MVQPSGMKPLNEQELQSFQEEIDRLHKEIQAQLGQEDVDYVYTIERMSRFFEVSGRVLIHFSLEPFSFGLGVFNLALHNILNSMELSHNILHGQYDWMNDPNFNSKTYRWDTVINEAQWRQEHNQLHHAFTNVAGKDPDLSYVAFRMTDKVRWYPFHTFQPVGILWSVLTFNYMVGLYVTGILEPLMPKGFESGKVRQEDSVRKDLEAFGGFARKAARQVFKNYVFFPILGGPMAPKIMLGNFMASIMRNTFAAAVIYCGHFTEDAQMFTEEEARDKRKGAWSLRQVLAAGNFEGSRLFSILCGHLNYQIEHHLFPRIPAWRYRYVAPRVREICERYGIPYNTGSFTSQFTGVVKRILRHSLPGPKAQSVPQRPAALQKAA